MCNVALCADTRFSADPRAALCTHAPDPGRKLVRYYGAFSNAHWISACAPASASAPPAGVRGMRQNDAAGRAAAVNSIIALRQE
jgi:hypothetical protein